MPMNIKQLRNDVHSSIDKIQTADDLEQFRVTYLGKKGKITNSLRSIGAARKDERVQLGKELNALRSETEKKIEQLSRRISELTTADDQAAESVDVTLPGTMVSFGNDHPITKVFNEIIDIFIQLGFVIAEGPEIETDFNNFEALNFPPNHPARDTQDTFFLDVLDDTRKPFILRTHTSPVQIRLMQSMKPPIRAIMPGRVFRHEALDASHSMVFHQVEGLVVGDNITFADLKAVLVHFVRRMYGPDVSLQFRPTFFPFTEPSAQVDIQCIFCKGKGCAVCKKTGWIEMMGAGMVHPRVLKAVGYDPEKVTGYAFGMGVERIAMNKFHVNDMRLFFENDLRFLKQF
ncbi:MAG: phenylalanine--tRNA ligase subunit alpha [Elusimicrobia bacterium]|nr:phenylalanine--tRNA ligase subunit alpha [Elusimicrobiota bacterium]MBD3411694.1 phenylalanine--tRNA ligase subunit alpha [Elusimicrobiota bacterium]